jgi:uncharacterized protein YndB with AHSA1/START domain
MTVPDRIEREILIEAPREVVWRVMTEPGQIVQWFCDEARLELDEGGSGVFTWENRATSRPFTANLRVVLLDRPHRFAFRWAYPDGEEPTEANSTMVEFTLVDEDGHTRLQLRESGLHELAWTDDAKQRFVDDHDYGWDVQLPHLREFAEQQATSTGAR